MRTEDDQVAVETDDVDLAAPEPGRRYTDDDGQADAAHQTLKRSRDKEVRRQALVTLGALAEAGSAVAQYHLGEIFAGSPDDEGRCRGLRSHIRAAESGYLGSLVAIQRHEDPLLEKFDLLRDPTPLGVPASVVSDIRSSRYLRIALLAEGLAAGVAGYGRDLADEILDEVNYAPAAIVSYQEHHLLALAYGLLRDHYDHVRQAAGPGSRAAIEHNQAIAAGFAGWGDRKAREHIGRSELLDDFSAEVAKPLRDYGNVSGSPIPASLGKQHSITVAISADRVIGLLDGLGKLDELRRGNGADLVTGLLWFFAAVELGFGWDKARSVALDLSAGYRNLGGGEGLASYMMRLFGTHASVQFVGETTSAKGFHNTNHIGDHLGSGSKREVLILHSASGRFEKREEYWGHSQIYIPRQTDIQSQHNNAYVTEGRFFLTFHDGQACLSLFNEIKRHEIKTSSRDVKREEQVQRLRTYTSLDVERCTKKEEKVEPVMDFPAHQYVPIDALRPAARHGDAPRAARPEDDPDAEPDDFWDIDSEVQTVRLNQISQSVRGGALDRLIKNMEAASTRFAELKKNANAVGLMGMLDRDRENFPKHQATYLAEKAKVDAAEQELILAMRATVAQEEADREWRRRRSDQGFDRRSPPKDQGGTAGA